MVRIHRKKRSPDQLHPTSGACFRGKNYSRLKGRVAFLPAAVALASCAPLQSTPITHKTMRTDLAVYLARQEQTGLTIVASNTGNMPGLLGPVEIAVTRGGCEGSFTVRPTQHATVVGPGETSVVRYAVGKRAHRQPRDCELPSAISGFAYGTALVTTFAFDGTTTIHEFEVRTRRIRSYWGLEDVTYRPGPNVPKFEK